MNDIEQYNYNLPEELIAQKPLENRSDSRLLVLDRDTGKIKHKMFYNIVSYLHKGDVLVLNDTKVIPGRIYGIKEQTNANIEVLLLHEINPDTYECLVKPQKRVKVGTILNFNNLMKGEVVNVLNDGITHITFTYKGIFHEILDKIGLMPLPPYIHETLKDQNRYQTVYAKFEGSAAAPTAGLHFTDEILKSLEEKGVEILFVTLHVGIGTFRPVSEKDISKHEMHSEKYIVTKYVADRLNKAKDEGRRIISVGTTSLRTLEANYTEFGKFCEATKDTSIFLYPPYKIKSIDGLITNFHLPKSTLIMLVSCLAGRKNILSSYQEAVKEKYRFFSFGDAMFIKPNNYVKHTAEYKKILRSFNTLTPDIKSKGYKVYNGSNNILISVPHAFKHIRDEKEKVQELNTSNIAKILYKYTSCNIIYTYKNNMDDANYNSNLSYREEVKNIIKSNNIKYFIDLHGIDNKYKYDLIIGTNKYKNVFNDKEIINNITSIFKNNLSKETVIDKIYKAGENTLSYFVSTECNVKAIQLEISKNYRKMLRRPKSFNKTIKTLIKVIELLERN